MPAHAKLLAGLLAGTCLVASPPAVAAIGAAPGSDPAADSPAEAGAAEPTLAQALESGDLTTARELAVAAREGDPTPENWLVEAQVLDALGDYAGAADGYRGYLDALGDDADASDQRAEVEQRLEELREQARGRVADEPASTHRTDIDAERAEREAANQLKPPPPPPAAAPPRDRIVKKWYFWVTLAAIAGAAGAITGISIKAANQERKDSLDRVPGPATGPGGGVLIRF